MCSALSTTFSMDGSGYTNYIQIIKPLEDGNDLPLDLEGFSISGNVKEDPGISADPQMMETEDSDMVGFNVSCIFFNTALTRVYSTPSKSKIRIQTSAMRRMRSIFIQHTDCLVYGLLSTTCPLMSQRSTLTQSFAVSCQTNIKQPSAKESAVLEVFLQM